MILTLGVITVTQSQNIELTPIGGYMFGGAMRVYQGELVISDGASYGVQLSTKMATAGTFAELAWWRMDSDAAVRVFGLEDQERLFKLATEYYQIGASQRGPVSDMVDGFASFTAGATRFHAKETDRRDKWLFSSVLSLGFIAHVSERIGIRLQGRLMVPMAFASGSLWCGTAGCAVGYGSYATLVQGDFSAGVVVKF